MSEAPLRDQVRDLTLIFVLGLPLAVTVAGLGGYVLARGALKPVEMMAERAREITADRLGERLPVAHPDDEMGRLATVFNETLGRLQHSFEQMRQFTSDVSHELRTPLTSIRSVGEVGLRGRHDEHGYRGIIGSMLEEVDRLARLVDRLLTLSRAEMGQAQLSPEVVDLHALAENVVGIPERARRGEEPAGGGRARGHAIDAGGSPGAAAGPHQSRGQRDQVHAGGRPGAGTRVGNARARPSAT